MSRLEELKATSDRIDQILAGMRERNRREDLLRGISDEDRARMNAERDANAAELTARLKAENDALEAELTRRRTLRLVSSE